MGVFGINFSNADEDRLKVQTHEISMYLQSVQLYNKSREKL